MAFDFPPTGIWRYQQLVYNVDAGLQKWLETHPVTDEELRPEYDAQVAAFEGRGTALAHELEVKADLGMGVENGFVRLLRLQYCGGLSAACDATAVPHLCSPRCSVPKFRECPGR